MIFPILKLTYFADLQGTIVSEETAFRFQYFMEFERGETPSVHADLTAYRGPGKPPEWIDQITDKSAFVFEVETCCQR